MALTGDNTRNFEEMLKMIPDADGQISVSDYTDVDALLFAEIAGIDIENLAGPYSNAFQYNGDGTVSYHANESFTLPELIKLYESAYDEEALQSNDKYRLLKAMSESPRYKDITFTGFADSKDKTYRDEQGNEYTANYKAVTVEVPDGKIISYAGTGSSIFGWIEDGRMACTNEGIGAQVWGREYAEYMMNRYGADDFSFCGYSKGGNQATYTTAMLFGQYGDRIKKTINIDGPGFSMSRMNLEVNGKSFREILAELYEIGVLVPVATPYTSFVGSLMEDHQNYVYLDADAWLMFVNHDYTYWNMILDENGIPSFQKSDVDMPTEASQAFDKMIEGLLSGMTNEELDHLMDALENLCKRLYIHNTGDMLRFFTSTDNSVSEKLAAVLEIYNDMDESQQDAFDKMLQGLMTDENLETFLIVWRQELETSTSEEARRLAETLKSVEAFYPVIASLLEDLDIKTLLHTARIACGYLEKIGGAGALEDMSAIDIAVSLVDYFMNLRWADKGRVITLIGKSAASIGKDYAKDHPIVTCLATVVIILLSVLPSSNLAAKLIMGVNVGAALIAMLWDEYFDDIIDAAESVVEWSKGMFESIKNEVINAIKALGEALMDLLGNLWDKFLELASWAAEKIGDFIAEFDIQMHEDIQELHVKIDEPIYYTARSIHSVAETRLEMDGDALEDLNGRMIRVASKAARLESLLDSLRWKLQYQETETKDEKKISLAEKYNVNSSSLAVSQASILRAGSDRLSDAAAVLRAMDGKLLRG